MKLSELKVGDGAIRMMAGVIEMPLKITSIDDEFIYCGDWKFSKRTGAEIDEYLGWTETYSGFYLKL